MATRVVVPELRDELLTNIQRQRADFERVWNERFENLRRSTGVLSGDGSLIVPEDDPFYVEFRVRGEERLKQYDTAYKERLTAVEAYEAEVGVIPPDPTTPEQEEAHEMKTVNKFLVGADPEFGAYKAGRPIAINNYGFRHTEPFGYDHGGRVVELKPNPARSSFRVVRNIRKLILDDPNSRKLLKDGIRYQAGAKVRNGGRDDLGGHIHLGIPFTTEDTFRAGEDRHMTPTAQVREIVRTLDRYTGVLEALDILPQLEARERRNSGNAYGQFGDVRCANTHNHMEYRTMCSWMHSPIAAMIALTGAKLCAVDPDEAYRLMGPETSASIPKLLRFFEAYKESDIDAARVVEKIIENKQELLKAVPDANMVSTWRDLVPAIA